MTVKLRKEQYCLTTLITEHLCKISLLFLSINHPPKQQAATQTFLRLKTVLYITILYNYWLLIVRIWLGIG